jgi:hypothetical protein
MGLKIIIYGLFHFYSSRRAILNVFDSVRIHAVKTRLQDASKNGDRGETARNETNE